MSRPTQRAVSPRDCALAVGIPLTREQFLEDLARPEANDYASHFKRTSGYAGHSDEFFADLFDQSASTARRVCDEVERRGVRVLRGARAGDMPELFHRFQVVTLVTHWRFPSILPEEILDERALLLALAAPAGRMQQAASRAVRTRTPEIFDNGDAQTLAASPDRLRATLAAALNRVAADAHAHYNSEGDAPQPAPTSDDPEDALLRLTRDELEHVFDGLIAPGKSLEFADGMASSRDLVAAIPAGYDGVLDLTTCNSVIPGKAVKRVHKDCLVAMNRRAAALHVRMSKYKLIIEELRRRPAPFPDTMMRF